MCVCLVFLSFPLPVTAQSSPTVSGDFTGENWFTKTHPKVASFSVHTDGSTSGVTETGVSFRQYTVPNELGIRVQRFEIEDHFHYIVEGEIAYTFTELSSLLAQAYKGVTSV
jgi:hypothetical protein